MPRSRQSKKPKPKQRKRVTVEEGWWSIRAIIDERVSNGCTEYLVDWEPDSVSGKTYAPTWSSEVTEEAKREWESKKAPGPASAAETLVAASATESQDSQSPRPSNWRHLKRTRLQIPSRSSTLSDDGDDNDNDENPRKRARTAFSATLSEDSVPSFTTTPSVASVADTGDITFIETPYPQHQVAVEIPKIPGFDPSEYQSQSTVQTVSSQSLAELEIEDERLVVSSQISQRTVPDSQEPSGQSWSQDRRRSQVLTPGEVPESGSASPVQTSTCPQQLVVESSAGAAVSITAGSDIPSHQPLDSGARAHQVPQTSGAHSITNDREVSVSQQSAVTDPVFLTQPCLPSGTQLGSSLHSLSLARVEATTSEDNSTSTSRQVDQPDQRDSQAAQIIRHDTEPPPEEFTTSSGTREGTASASGASKAQEACLDNREDPPLIPFEEFGSSFRAESFCAYAERLSQNRSTPSPVLAMEPSSSARRVSAVDELKQLCSFDDIITDPEPASAADETTEVGAHEASSQTELQMRNADSMIPPPPVLSLDAQPSDQPTPWIAETATLQQDMATGTLASASLLTQPPMEPLSEVNTQASSSLQDVPSGALLSGAPEMQQTTISPADITRLIVDDTPTMDPTPLLAHSGISPRALDLSGESVTMAQLPIRSDEDTRSLPSTPSDASPVEHLITLPFQARIRPLYDDTILDYRNEVKKFGEIFNSEIYTEPDSSLLARIDELLGRLQSLCDYPQDFDGNSLAKLSPLEQVKYAYDANPKFNFVLELLQVLQKDTNVLVVAKSREILEILFYIAESLQVECRCEALDRTARPGSSVSPTRLTIALPTEQIDALAYDIVIGFDPTYASSVVAKQLSSLSDRKSPHVLLLVTTHAIEHIDLRIPGDLPSSERRNALLSGIVRARKLVSDPERGYPEPYEVAKIFGDYFNGADELAVPWEPVPIPDHVLDFYEASYSQNPVQDDSSKDEDNGHKRKLDDEDGGDAKRLRMLPLKESLVAVNEPMLTDEVRRMLAGPTSRSIESNANEAKILVSVSVLEALAEEHAGYHHRLNDTDYVSEYKSVIAVLEKQIKEYERTINQVYSKHRAAIQDRTRFEKEKKGSDAALEASVKSARLQGENYQKKISELEATITRLTAASSDAQASESSVQPLKEAGEKIEALEKKLNSARTQLDFVTNQYQDTRSEATAMRTEITELKRQNLQLQQTASENFARIHEIQAESSGKQYLAQISELKTLLRERELELDRTRDELHQLKNGRRETRQVSMPRSPRMGMMSPRTARGYGGSTSRGTSPAPGSGTEGAPTTPVPGMQYLTQQTGNVRWNHLRE